MNTLTHGQTHVRTHMHVLTYIRNISPGTRSPAVPWGPKTHTRQCSAI